MFPNAAIVFDRFHVMKAVNLELNKIRNQVGVKNKNSKYILLKNGVDLTVAQKEKLSLIFQHSNRLRKAYGLKEGFREIYELRINIEEGKKKFNLWLDKAKTVYCDVITTIRNHLEGICNYFISRTTSGVMEGINNKCE
ncbi:MAG: transposase [Acaryochloridaceae cyanobacterium CSU_3_4]|nr:transposase [Acaryochloridaceae cyanobacterium CSU_3_4]